MPSKYATLQDAKSDGFIARGWLPDFLPSTTVNIRASNNLDLNTSTGEFEFQPSEFPLFATRLHEHQARQAPFKNWEAHVQEKFANGHFVGEFNENRATWVFLCPKARNSCQYVMWLHRHG